TPAPSPKTRRRRGAGMRRGAPRLSWVDLDYEPNDEGPRLEMQQGRVGIRRHERHRFEPIALLLPAACDLRLAAAVQLRNLRAVVRSRGAERIERVDLFDDGVAQVVRPADEGLDRLRRDADLVPTLHGPRRREERGQGGAASLK